MKVPEGSRKLITIGLDVGASRIRVAGDRHRHVTLIPHRYANERPPFVVELPNAQEVERSCRITSLKRMLDFEKTFPVPPTGRNSIELLAGILRAIRSDCQDYVCDNEVNCVVTVPPCFSQRQRSALRTTVARADFSRIRLIDDTLAALLECRELVQGCERVLVYSLGASSFSAVLYQPSGERFRPLAQEGNRTLGGDDIDAEISSRIIAALGRYTHDSLSPNDPDMLLRLVGEAERAKKNLATGRSVTISLSNLLGQSTPSMLHSQSVAVTREILEGSIARLITETMALVENVLNAGGCQTPDAVLTVGGMALLPSLRDHLQERCRVSAVQAGEDAVAIGAVIHGNMMTDTEWEELDKSTSKRESVWLGGYHPLKAPRSTIHHNSDPSDGTDEPPEPWANHFVPLLYSAQQQYEKGYLRESIDTFDKLFVELYKYSGDLYRKAAMNLEAAGKLDEAILILQKANQRDRSNRLVAVDLAQACYRNGIHAGSRKNSGESIGMLDEAISAIRALSNGKEAYPVLLGQLLHLNARVLWEQGRRTEAEAAVKESVQLDPKNDVYQKDLAKIHGLVKNASVRNRLPPGEMGVGRNEKCPCGSGRKYKKCCGKGK